MCCNFICDIVLILNTNTNTKFHKSTLKKSAPLSAPLSAGSARKYFYCKHTRIKEYMEYLQVDSVYFIL